MALAIKWHTSEERWWRSPGKDKFLTSGSAPGKARTSFPPIAPDLENVLRYMDEFEVDQDWNFGHVPMTLQTMLFRQVQVEL
eukprot:4287118-Prorocentrum_lima.AAC.1